MDLENMKRKYAYTLARVGLNVQKGQTVLVEAALEGWQFTSIFAEECYKLGAGNVVVNYLDQANLKVGRPLPPRRGRPPGWRTGSAPCTRKYLDEGACYVRLEGVNPQLMEGRQREGVQRHFRPCGRPCGTSCARPAGRSAASGSSPWCPPWSGPSTSWIRRGRRPFRNCGKSS